MTQPDKPLNLEIETSRGPKLFEFGAAPEAKAEGYGSIVQTFVGSDQQALEKFKGIAVALVRGPEIFGQKGYFEFGVMEAKSSPSAEGVVCQNLARTPAVQQVITQCGGDLWQQCAQYDKSSWAHEVSESDTVLGYWEWVVSSAESDGVDLNTLTGPAPKRPRSPRP